MKQLKIALVDDEALFRDGMAAILTSHGYEIVGSYASGPSFLEAIANDNTRPDIVLLDLKMEPLDGIETAKETRKVAPAIHIIIVSSYYRPSFIEYMIQLGISSFLPKNIDPKELIFAMTSVSSKGIYLTEEHVATIRQLQSVKSRKPDINKLNALTRREQEVLQLICEEYTAKEIAEKLFLSVRTIEGHRNNILVKTGAKNTAGLVVYAMMNNVVDLEEKILRFTLN